MEFVLDPLPYEKDALQPHISARTVDLHYDKHHRGYLTKLEEAIRHTSLADKSLEEIVVRSAGPVFNQAAQVWNHNFYWRSLRPDGGGPPPRGIVEPLRQAFGSAGTFKRQLIEVAADHFGSGWAWLVLDRSGKLCILSTSDADNPLRREATPLLTIDVWEHAYYLDYENDRKKHLEAVVENLLNWDFAVENLEKAKKAREQLAA